MISAIITFSLLLVLSGLFSSLETAFTSLTPYDVEDLRHHKGRRGRLVYKITRKPEVLLTTLLFGNNLVNIGASALMTKLTIELLGSQFIGSMTGIMTLVVLIFCEVTPKQIALSSNRQLALTMAGFILVLTWVLRPIIWIITQVSTMLTSLFTRGKRSHFTLNNLLQMVKVGERMGIVEQYENQMVKNVFRINDTSVQAIMTHRTETYCLDRDRLSDSVFREIVEKRVSRIPLYKDDPENIVGILLVKDFLSESAVSKEPFALKTLERKPVFVSRNSKVDELYQVFRHEDLNIAIVLDEYGGLDGIVTIHDVIQEIFGNLDDEDEEKEPEKIIQRGSDWLIQGDADFYDIQDVLGIDLEHSKDIHTISGFMIDQLGHIPDIGEKISVKQGSFIIKEAEKNRILSVLFKKSQEK